jgi:redox-regulated HSP33 family molecular chaperone
MMKILPTRSVLHLSLTHNEKNFHHVSKKVKRKGDLALLLNDKVRKRTMRKVKKNVEMELEAAEDSGDNSQY